MRILVTGATGYLGHHVVHHLAAANHTVTALIRRPEQKKIFIQNHCEFSIGDIRDLDSVIQAASCQEAIVHCAALVNASTAEEFAKVNINGTRNVVEAANANKDTQHLIMLSSVGVYGGPDEGQPRNESTPPHPENHYATSKLEAEIIARDKLDPGKTLTILRPTGFYGPSRPLYASLVKSWRKMPVLLSLSGDEIIQPCHVLDVCNVIEKSLNIISEHYRVFVVAGERPLGLRGLYTELARHVGIHLRYIILPAWLAIPAIQLLGWSGKITAERSRFLLSKARGRSPGARYDTSNVESELDVQWVPISEGIREMAKSLT